MREVVKEDECDRGRFYPQTAPQHPRVALVGKTRLGSPLEATSSLFERAEGAARSGAALFRVVDASRGSRCVRREPVPGVCHNARRGSR